MASKPMSIPSGVKLRKPPPLPDPSPQASKSPLGPLGPAFLPPAPSPEEEPKEYRVEDELWFHPGLSGGHAAALLAGQPPGTFLVRDSSQANTYALSFVSPSHTIQHARIVKTEDGKYAEHMSGQVWDSVYELVFSNPDFLSYPILRDVEESLPSPNLPSAASAENVGAKKDAILPSPASDPPATTTNLSSRAKSHESLSTKPVSAIRSSHSASLQDSRPATTSTKAIATTASPPIFSPETPSTSSPETPSTSSPETPSTSSPGQEDHHPGGGLDVELLRMNMKAIVQKSAELNHEVKYWKLRALDAESRDTAAIDSDDAEPLGADPADYSSFGSIWSFSEEGEHLVEVERVAHSQYVVHAGSIIKLVEWLTHPRLHDHNFMTTFFITYPSFTSATELMQLLRLRYYAPAPKYLPREQQRKHVNSEQKLVRIRTVAALRHWLQQRPYDLEDRHLRRRFELFIVEVVEDENTRKLLHKALEKAVAKIDMRKQVALLNAMAGDQGRVLEATTSRLRDLEAAVSNTRGLLSTRGAAAPPSPMYPKKFRDEVTIFLVWPQVEIARQLTLIGFELFGKVKPSEFLNQAWNIKDEKERRKAAPNICLLIDRFNRSSCFMASILVQIESLEMRKAMLKKWILVAEECARLNNFMSLLEIVSGLSSPAVTRLHRTWAKLDPSSKAKLKELETLTNPSHNWQSLRDLTKQCAPPKLPYIGTALADLTFIEDGNPDVVGDPPMINMRKRKLLADSIIELTTFQNTPYCLAVVPFLRKCLLNFPMLDKEECWKRSNELEPKLSASATTINAYSSSPPAESAGSARSSPTAHLKSPPALRKKRSRTANKLRNFQAKFDNRKE